MKKPTRHWRAILLIFDAAVIILCCVAFYDIGPGLSKQLTLLCITMFFVYACSFFVRNYSMHGHIPLILTTEVVFTIFYYLLFFHPYVLHLLGIEDYRISAHIPFTYPDGANQGLLLAVTGFVSFHFGALLPRDGKRVSRRDPPELPKLYDLFDKLFTFCFASLLFFYMASGLRPADIGRYTDASAGDPVSDGLYVIIIMLCVVAISRCIVTLASARRLRIEHWIMLGLAAFWAVRILVGGDRNNFLIIALAAGGGIAAFLSPIRWPLLIGAYVGALVVYQTVEIARMMPEATVGGFLDAYMESRRPAPGSSSLSQTTATLRATFAIVPDAVSYGYGRYKLIGFMGVIPLVRGYVFAGADYFTSTADALTYHITGPDAGWSVGSNILSDIYMDFGLPGVPILIALVGYGVARVRTTIARRGPTNKLVFLYLILMGTVGEMPRYSLDFPIRMTAWGLLMFFAYEFVFNPRWRGIIRSFRYNRATSIVDLSSPVLPPAQQRRGRHCRSRHIASSIR